MASLSSIPENSSVADYLSSLSNEQRAEILETIPQEQIQKWLTSWRFWARPKQIEPSYNPRSLDGSWNTWLILAGRGWGKTRTGAEWVKERVKGEYGPRCKRLALVAPTAADARDVMVEGESGILSISDSDFMPVYKPSKRQVIWPNGAIATLYSADKPARLRGPQHDGAWSDELGVWRYPEAWDMLQFGLRLGKDPKNVVTTTPRPIPVIKDLVTDPSCYITEGSTYENSGNLAPTFLNKLVKRYEGTRLGKQEIYAKLLGDVLGALWNQDVIDRNRVGSVPKTLYKIIVGVDPAASTEEGSAETGIIVVGAAVYGSLAYGYVLDDYSIAGTPNEWGKQAIKAYEEWNANYIVGERNNGGEMVESTVRTIEPLIPFRSVWASKGKYARAEPISSIYEQNRFKHVGYFAELESQMTQWVPPAPGKSSKMPSPDRMDAMVWAASELDLVGLGSTEVNEHAVISNDGPFDTTMDDPFGFDLDSDPFPYFGEN